jgi:hypothetical protein
MIVDCLSCMDDHDEPAHCMDCDAELAGHDWPLCAACMDHEVANRTAWFRREQFVVIRGECSQ